MTVFDAPIARAASRFAIPEALVRAVIAVESNGAVFAVSPKGAMGLMQLMPGTWEELRLRYALGTNPFDPCDNIFAGTAYLRELLDRYGDPGFLAAYNAGPGRYQAYLKGRRSLPAETIAYVAKLSGRMPAFEARAVARTRPDPNAWLHSGLFARARNPSPEPVAPPEEASTKRDEQPVARPSDVPRDTIFVPRSGDPK
jgi:soluble lytic murein transglycosylase-like protein